jgi:hypothetical protein
MPGKWGPNSHTLNHAPEEERNAFIRDNAVALVLQLEAKCERQRKALTQRDLAIEEMRKLILAQANRIAAQAELLARKAEK